MPPRCHRVGRFSEKVVKPKASTQFFNKKVSFLLELQFSCTPFFMENTSSQQIFPSIHPVHGSLLKYLVISARLPPDFSWKTSTDGMYGNVCKSWHPILACLQVIRVERLKKRSKTHLMAIFVDVQVCSIWIDAKMCAKLFPRIQWCTDTPSGGADQLLTNYFC